MCRGSPWCHPRLALGTGQSSQRQCPGKHRIQRPNCRFATQHETSGRTRPMGQTLAFSKVRPERLDTFLRLRYTSGVAFTKVPRASGIPLLVTSPPGPLRVSFLCFTSYIPPVALPTTALSPVTPARPAVRVPAFPIARLSQQHSPLPQPLAPGMHDRADLMHRA